jgi:hypothetical protein
MAEVAVVVATILLVTHQIEVMVLENLEEVAVAVADSTEVKEPLHNLEQMVLAAEAEAEDIHQTKLVVMEDLELLLLGTQSNASY